MSDKEFIPSGRTSPPIGTRDIREFFGIYDRTIRRSYGLTPVKVAPKYEAFFNEIRHRRVEQIIAQQRRTVHVEVKDIAQDMKRSIHSKNFGEAIELIQKCLFPGINMPEQTKFDRVPKWQDILSAVIEADEIENECNESNKT